MLKIITMHRIVVTDSTPIISLLRIGQLEILKDTYQEIIIPYAVLDEVTIKDTRFWKKHDWIHAIAIKNLAAKEMFSSALHAGEVEVMLLSKEIGADLVIMDDSLARRHAKYLGLTVTGTIGVLLRAKSIGVIKNIAPVLNKLIQNGFYISDNVFREIMRLADE